jgi:hypothetical protein
MQVMSSKRLKGGLNQVKTKEEAKANLEQSLTYVGDRYTNAVKRADWSTKAGSDQAERNYAESVAKAVAQKSRQTAVKKVSNSSWQEAAATKGGAVIAQRMRDSLDKQATKWAPIYDSVVSAVSRLPARTVDWRSNVTNRVVGTVEAWKKASGKL